MSTVGDEIQPEATLRDNYALSRGEAASMRLNLQHYLFKDVIGFNIHPDLTLKAESSRLQIADIGTGTGIWTIDVRRQFPESTIDGFDISTDQFPPQAWLPNNVSLKYLNAFQPVPTHFIGKYDIVHVRLFMLVIPNGDPEPVLKNLMTMLRPGGRLQWVEHDPHAAKIVPASSDLEHSASAATLSRIQSFGDFSWVSQLGSSCRDIGFIDVSVHIYQVPNELQEYWQQIVLMAAEDVTFVAMDNDKPEAPGPLFRKMIQDALAEMRTGCGMTWDPIVLIAAKAKR